jgi:putative transposase
MLERHRKTRRVFNEPGHVHFLTFSCFHRLALLSGDAARQWLIEAVEAARQKQRFTLHAYAVMPEHAHLLVRSLVAPYDVSAWLRAIKRPVAWKARQHLVHTGRAAWLRKLTVSRGGKAAFRFWDAGGGFDRNIWRLDTLREVIDYIHANPVRRGLVASPTEWAWSSARFWNGHTDVPLRMDPLPL